MIKARIPRNEFLPSRSSLLRTARNFQKELPLPRNEDGEDLLKGTSLRKGGEGWRARGSSLSPAGKETIIKRLFNVSKETINKLVNVY